MDVITDVDFEEDEDESGYIDSSARAELPGGMSSCDIKVRDPFTLQTQKHNITYRRKQVIDDKSVMESVGD